jgi:hypothetical protein
MPRQWPYPIPHAGLRDTGAVTKEWAFDHYATIGAQLAETPWWALLRQADLRRRARSVLETARWP